MFKFNTVDEFEQAFDDSMLDDEYAEYIMENCHGDRVVCNGHTLTAAMEDLYLYEDFRDSMLAPATA